ncbi:hypothetical protein RJT34_11264 [Clitoria ternatea]|uniref:Alpha-galactosidase n=1 Tax=Clitoria ternatea TaxID=43366 RepID=A0AAN9JJM3_CLITE
MYKSIKAMYKSINNRIQYSDFTKTKIPYSATMKLCISAISFCFLLCFCAIQRVTCDNAIIPPRGWNSYDSFSWIISEEEYLQNANIISQRLLAHGYEYAVVDYLWYRSLEGGNSSFGFDRIDNWGRMLPDPERWPSSKEGNGFTEVANKVHNMSLKFGVHLMAGLSHQAFTSNTPILDTKTGKAYVESGREWHAKDIGIPSRPCKWMPNGFIAINASSPAGKAFLRSIYHLYASWGVDYVKLDCVFGDDLDLNEITSVSEILRELSHSIVFSLSPGVRATPEMAKGVVGLVNMYRVTADDWDEWPAITAHFNVARDFAKSGLIGAPGLKGKSWPDLDMIPFGWLTEPGANHGPNRFSRLNQDEKRTQMTLWSVAKSPIMYGGDLRTIDAWTYDLITNPTLLEINSFSSNNQEACETSLFLFFFCFPTIAILKEVKTREHSIKKVMLTRSLALTGCTDPKASGWYSEKYNQDLERICYKKSPKQDEEEPFCMHKRKLPITSLDEGRMHNGKVHLAAINNKQFCSKACTNQEIWELKSKGTLVNAHSGMCAIVEYDQVEGYPDGIRSWIATGRKGEIYVAFFNLNDVKASIATLLIDLSNALLVGRTLTSCTGIETWSGKSIQTTKILSAEDVPGHGCALFVLNCQ